MKSCATTSEMGIDLQSAVLLAFGWLAALWMTLS